MRLVAERELDGLDRSVLGAAERNDVAAFGLDPFDDSGSRFVIGTNVADMNIDISPAGEARSVRFDNDGNVLVGHTTSPTNSATKCISVGNAGAEPNAGTADAVVVYSIDDAAGHTIPGFYCEGTNVLATGQADSASSVRVKMRINGTTVTLLAI